MREPLKVYVAGARPNVQAALERAIRIWNDAVGGRVLELVEDGTKGAVPIRLSNEQNQWYEGMAQDEEAEFTQGQVRGTVAALLNEADLTLVHELGHALGLRHPYPTSTPEDYVPATEKRVARGMEGPRPARAWRVAPVGVMGNEMNPNDPNYRGAGPSQGEIEFLRERFGITNPITRTRDTTSAIRNRPAEITPTSSRNQLVATAMYLSGRIARLLGVEEIPLDQLDINWAELDEAAGRYRPAATIFDEPDVDLDRVTIRNWPSPTKVLAHELAHAYMLNGGLSVANKGQGWVQESLADYVTTRLGFIEGIQAQPDDPKLGYTAGSRFLAWLDEFSPGAGMAFTRLMSTGLIGASEAAQKVTGHPLEYLLAAYEEDPFVQDAEGPLARMLRNRADMSFLGQRAMDIYLKKSQMFMKQVAKAQQQEKQSQAMGGANKVFNRWWQLSGEKYRDPEAGAYAGTRGTKPGPGGYVESPSTESEYQGRGASALRRRAAQTPDEQTPETSKQVR